MTDNKKKWITNINGEWRMTWIEKDGIADRKLYWYEKIRYFYKFISLEPKFKKGYPMTDNKKKQNKIVSKCCKADIEYTGGGVDEETVFPVLTYCKKCMTTCDTRYLKRGRPYKLELPF